MCIIGDIDPEGDELSMLVCKYVKELALDKVTMPPGIDDECKNN